MNITSLQISNFVGVSAVKIEPKEPIVLVAGPNAAGKSSIYQAIRLALFDDIPRVDLKRDVDALVRNGAGKGSITVVYAAGEDEGTATVFLPSRNRNGDIGYMTYYRKVFDIHAFAALEPAERMRMVRAMSGVQMGREAIEKKLAERGVDPQIVEELGPMIRLGFDSCAEHAKMKASEARGAWKARTGETYGSDKAEGWKAPKAETLPDAPASIDEATKKHAEAVDNLRRLTGRVEQAVRERDQQRVDSTLAGKVDVLRQRIADARPVAESDIEKAVPACPECGAALEMVDGKLVKYVATKSMKVSAAARQKARQELNAAEAELTQALAAVERQKAPYTPFVPPTEETIIKAEQAVVDAADVLRSITEQQRAYDQAKAAAKSTEQREQQAAAEHVRVKGWVAVAEAMAPNGIPSELMTLALQPFRAAINECCASENLAEWPLPTIAEDGTITAHGRPYALLSESERYRVDAILTVAIAKASESNIVAMDRADVLEPKTRSALMGWLLDMVDDGVLEQAWVFATLKSKPESLVEGIETFWIENGAVA